MAWWGKESNIMVVSNFKEDDKEFHFRLPVGIIKDLFDLSQERGNEKYSGKLPIKMMKIILALFQGKEDHTEEFTLKLPLSVIRKLIVSYWENIKDSDQEWVYIHQTGGPSLRSSNHGNFMLNVLGRELNRKGLKGQKIIDEEFNRNCKKDYDDMKKFQKKEERVKKHVEKVFKDLFEYVSKNYIGVPDTINNIVRGELEAFQEKFEKEENRIWFPEEKETSAFAAFTTLERIGH